MTLSVQTEFLISLFVLLACALIAGEVALRLGQLPLVGQLIIGVILGPTLLGPYIGLSVLSPQLSTVQLLATFFLLFLAGLEIGPNRIYRMRGRTVLLGLAIFFVPFALTVGVVEAVAPHLGALTSAFVAVTLSITALPVMLVMVKELGLADRELGAVLVGSALVNELCAVTVFAVLLQVLASGNDLTPVSLVLSLGATALFLGVVFGAYFLLRCVHGRGDGSASTGRLSRGIRTQEAGVGLLMVLGLGAALLSQYLGLTFIIGAFYAGILVTPDTVGRKLHDRLRGVLQVIMWGLFLPLFFVITGLQTNFQLFSSPLAVVTLFGLLVVAMFSKIGTGSILARAHGFNAPDSLALGFLVNSRGAVEIAMAVILFTDGLLTTFWFTVVVAVGVVCTAIAPLGAVSMWKTTAESKQDLFARAPLLRLGGLSIPGPDDGLDVSGPSR